MRKVRLRNGLEVCALSKPDAEVIYHEIYEMQAYNKHGITVNDQDTVFDVGANIGLFSINLAQKHRGLKIYLYEPVSETFNCLAANCKANSGTSTFHLQNYGLSDEPASVTFDFSPSLSMMSGMYASELSGRNSKQASMFDWLVAMIEDIQRAKILPGMLSKLVLKSLSIPLLRILAVAIIFIPLSILFLWLTLTKKKVTCKLQTLSESILGQDIDVINLLKIDVEGAEMDVLRGIEERDWKKIRQLIIEVHDIEGRVQEMTRLLEVNGFAVKVDQEDWSLHKLMHIYTIYATRQHLVLGS